VFTSAPTGGCEEAEGCTVKAAVITRVEMNIFVFVCRQKFSEIFFAFREKAYAKVTKINSANEIECK
jgi:hypothetical protein